MLLFYHSVLSLIASLSVQDTISMAQKWSPVITYVYNTPTLGISDVPRYTRFITSAYESSSHGLVHVGTNSLSIFLISKCTFVASLTTCHYPEFQDVVRDVTQWHETHSGTLAIIADEHML